MASASISPPHSRANFTMWTGCRRFFDVINQDPIISQVKLIAEPWDVGEGGYQVGNFPRCGRSGTENIATPSGVTGKATTAVLSELGYRLTGSSDLYQAGRPPAFRQHQFHYCARRLHAERSGQLQREAQRGKRRKQRGRRERQQLLESRASKVRLTIPGSSNFGSARSGISWQRFCCRMASQ